MCLVFSHPDAFSCTFCSVVRASCSLVPPVKDISTRNGGHRGPSRGLM